MTNVDLTHLTIACPGRIN